MRFLTAINGVYFSATTSALLVPREGDFPPLAIHPWAALAARCYVTPAAPRKASEHQGKCRALKSSLTSSNSGVVQLNGQPWKNFFWWKSIKGDRSIAVFCIKTFCPETVSWALFKQILLLFKDVSSLRLNPTLLCHVKTEDFSLRNQLFSVRTKNYFPILKVSNESPRVAATASGGYQCYFTGRYTPFNSSPASLRGQAVKIKQLGEAKSQLQEKRRYVRALLLL